jgi:DNA ligase (NAD+)
LEPVAVGGVTVTSATVHNPSQIAQKGLRLPGTDGNAQRVWVRRAGEVIPEVVGPVDELSEGTIPFEPPEKCPRCGSSLNQDGLVWRCSRGRDCGIEEGIRYAVGRDTLDLDGMGDKIVRSLIESGTVSSVADLFSLDMVNLLTVDRLGERNAAKILDSIEEARSLPLSRVFCALGVAMTGRSMSRRLAKHFGTFESLRRATVEELTEVEGVGPERALAIRSELDALSPVVDRLIAMGVGLAESAEPVVGAPLAGQTVVVSGSVPGMSRNAANEAVERLGGKSSGSISAKTTLAVIGEGAGQKAEKAEGLGIKIMPADEFAALVATSA